MSLLKKDKNIKQSFIYGGYLIIKLLKRVGGKLSFFEVSAELSQHGIGQYRQQFFCLMFLYSCDLISFKEPYIELTHVN